LTTILVKRMWWWKLSLPIGVKNSIVIFIYHYRCLASLNR
jgi:hypothetical protein